MARISKEEKERINQRILVVANELFMKDGYDGVSTSMIAKQVGIAEGTLFNYYDSKMDIFLEALSSELERFDVFDFTDIFGKELAHEVTIQFANSVKMMLKLPKRILSEIFLQSIKLAKKKPEKLKKYIEIDMKYIGVLKEFIDSLVVKKILNEVDSQKLSEVIYAIIAYEMMFYVYEKNRTKEVMLLNIEEKIEILFKGYIKEENNEY
jgi:AcrR family transcriptional regulator